MSITNDPNNPCLNNLRPDGQQECYLVSSEGEFVRPVRRTYVHLECGTSTTMGQAIAETYARNPNFYNGTFCVHCKKHFPLVNDDGKRNFIWEDGSGVGT